MLTTLLRGMKQTISICQKALNDLPKTPCGTHYIS